MTAQVFAFGDGVAEGHGLGKELLGGKGAGLAEMTALGLPVPPGFTIATSACAAYKAAGDRLPDALRAEVRAALANLERTTGRSFGDPQHPLLVSVRSGARVSMPGMMDSVLNLGLTPSVAAGLAVATGNPRFAWDSTRRFIAMYADVVLGLRAESETEPDPFEAMLVAKKRARGVTEDAELSADDLANLARAFDIEVRRRTGAGVPEDPYEQLEAAIGAVFASWDTPRAKTYRQLYGYPADWGTAATVQAMVFGNLGDDSATGVVFTRDPVTGEKCLFGEFLVNAQGEDVVAGTRTPRPIAELEAVLPLAFAELVATAERLEGHFRDLQDLEFTIQRGQLYLLQTRNGKRSARAMLKVAVDLVREGRISRDEALLRVEPGKLEELLHPGIDPSAVRQPIARGLPASPGAAIGRVVFTASEAEAEAARGERVILVRVETSPEDIHGMKAAAGILTSRGGMTSHAAVVARGMGRPCVVAASGLGIDARAGTITAPGGVIVRRGDLITLDGGNGDVLLGELPLIPARQDQDFDELMRWVDGARRLRVRTNADTPADARTARAFGAEGIGLCRTEHMFFAPARLLAVRQMILAPDAAGRRAALAQILPMQREDFAGIFRAMDGLPVTVRLLDPPLHEFLPRTDADLAEVARALDLPPAKLARRNQELHEANPMLGHRGCRLAVSYPEIYETQVQALAEAAREVAAAGVRVLPEIMIPIVGLEEELARLRVLVETTFRAHAPDVPFSVGTMIELPRACLIAGRLARHADFFSFGTNDLTQTTFGISRDDAAAFLPTYLAGGLLRDDPFAVLDEDGVGALMRLAVEQGRAARPGLKLGLCGEHGGEPRSVAFCDALGLDYVSCSPFRVPIARAAAAQAALRSARGGNP